VKSGLAGTRAQQDGRTVEPAALHVADPGGCGLESGSGTRPVRTSSAESVRRSSVNALLARRFGARRIGCDQTR